MSEVPLGVQWTTGIFQIKVHFSKNGLGEFAGPRIVRLGGVLAEKNGRFFGEKVAVTPIQSWGEKRDFSRKSTIFDGFDPPQCSEQLGKWVIFRVLGVEK